MLPFFLSTTTMVNNHVTSTYSINPVANNLSISYLIIVA